VNVAFHCWLCQVFIKGGVVLLLNIFTENTTAYKIMHVAQVNMKQDIAKLIAGV